MRIKTDQLLTAAKNTKRLVILAAWTLVLCPLIVLLISWPITLPDPIRTAAIIAAAAPPVTACAAIALFLRLDAATTVVVTVTTMLLVPLSLPPIASYWADLDIDIQLWQLSLRLVGFISAAFILALLAKRCLGQARIDRVSDTLDGVSVLAICLFIIGVMDGVTELFWEKPTFVLLVLTASTMLVLGLYLISSIVFWRYGANTAMAVGITSGNCNLGLMYLVLVDQAPLEILIFFAIGQIPMYGLPTLLTPLVKHLQSRG